MTRLSLLAFMGFAACNTDVGKHVTPPPASTPPEPVASAPVVPRSAPPAPASVASAAGPPDGSANDPRREGQPDCRFERPTIWSSGHLSWLGSCREGFAQDRGVIVREFEKDLGLQPQRFYGSVRNGYLSVGVLEATGGYKAGTWTHGDLAPPLADDMAQRNVLINAFDVAAAAANAASKSFAKEGDAKSSRLYAEKAKQLREQMD
ncbi:MAG: hypothetical protein JW940_05255 [Polyangiaceae bacterium]|nr:hypothetical protein [Polyangiaceae bacterium]